MGNRRDVLGQLKEVLAAITEIKTVVRTYLEGEFDITQYAIEDLPLIAIPEPAEDTEEGMTSQRSIMALVTKLRVFFVDWAIEPNVTKYESLVKNIRDTMGANFTLNDTATEARIMSVTSVLGTMPVYNFVMDLEVRYYLNEQVT